MTLHRDEDGKYWDTWDGQPVWGMIPATAWEAATVEDVTDERDGVGEFLRAQRERLNVEMLEFGQFSVRPLDRFDWFHGGRLWSPVPPSRFAPVILSYPAVTERLAAVLDHPDLSLLVKFEEVSPLALDGLLAAQLVDGGAYSSPRDYPQKRAKELGAGFCRTLFGERYEDVQVAHADFAWSRWFFDIAWDRTWVISDKREQRVTVLCTSDTD
ncbi:MAG: hypothetical protein KDB73_17045 [Planctomycetes bacterium]|nr:hypothetical protein [Planctomycetota bacterium]